ncbi:hypothetical protein P0M11_12635 [Kaistella sp. PBT33-4]|uniref:hypothetical protein n=1 Tax=Kaistella sp. PBT33-4 TaxID=3032000 RepID=UPI0023D7EFC4|nr:hypothetical protein [Kaistella sp. PBT33-4]MDF0720846.1 hypothetical protein [Kaistella sp. PBT33-4]
MKTTNLHFFPEVDGLTKPADRLASITVKHFAVDDKFLHGYEEDKSESTCDNLWLPCRHCEASQPTYPAGGRCGHRSR